MEAASRPVLEPLSDLPVEEPFEGGLNTPAPTPSAAATPTAAAPLPATSRAPESDAVVSGAALDELLDPESLLGPPPPLADTRVVIGPDTSPAATPAEAPIDPEELLNADLLSAPEPLPDLQAQAAVPAPAPSAPRPAAGPELELSLLPDEPISPDAEPSAAASTGPPAAAKKPTAVVPATPKASAGSKPTAPTAAPVPSAAAAMAAASKSASAAKTASATATQKPSSSAKPAAPASKGASAPRPALKAVPTSKPSPPVLAAASTPVVVAAGAEPAPTPSTAAAPLVVPAPTAPPAASSASPAAQPTTAGQASPPMDRDFIARNQIVERYLSGRLPLKGATDFERFCKENPQLLDELGLPERVNAGLRLLEASGKPEPWQEAPQPFWLKLPVVLGLAAATLVLGIALPIVASHSAGKTDKIAKLQKQVVAQPLDAATATQTFRVLPNRDGATNTPVVTIGGGPAILADFKIDESRSEYKVFTITIDRVDQGRVGVIHNLAKDSNGNLRVMLNSSALGPGIYQFTIQGMSWRGDAEPDSWLTIGITR